MSDYLLLPPEEKSGDFWNMEHFPERFQFVIFRNWNHVEPSVLAKVLRTTEQQILLEAEKLGLKKFDPAMCRRWQKYGYLTIIRDNWLLLPYKQLLELLEISEERLFQILFEEDFMYHKMGGKKSFCPEIYYRKLSAEAEAATSKIRELIAPLQSCDPDRQEFDFLDTWSKPHPPLELANSDCSGKLRMVYSYCAPFGDVLMPGAPDPFPEGLLQQYQASNINAVWMPILLSQLTPWTGDEDFSQHWQQRQTTLRSMTDKLKKYGLKLFLYLNEPRSLPPHIASRHPKWLGPEHRNGSGFRALCINHAEVAQRLQNGIAELCRAVPDIGGFFTISMSENLTHCLSHGKRGDCVVCDNLPNPANNIIAVHKAIANGIAQAASSARIIAWNWGWEKPWDLDIVKNLPENVEIMCASETGLETDCCGIKGEIIDYSLAHPGPGPIAPRVWEFARKLNRKIHAKVQLNATWELSSLPYLPVIQLARKHMENLQKCGIDDLMLSWTLGGSPGGNMLLVDMSVKEWCQRISQEYAEDIEKACGYFSESFSNFPFNNTFLIYRGPQNFGCGNLLYKTPSNRKATMVGFCFDDLYTWTGWDHYPVQLLEDVFSAMADKWLEGVQILENIAGKLSNNHAFEELLIMAKSAHCIIKSSANQIAFYNCRDNKNDPQRLIEIAADEIEQAKKLLSLQRSDMRIGFEASNHYLYVENNLLEKILNCRNIIDSLQA